MRRRTYVVNYGYGPETVGWKEDRKESLGMALLQVLAQVQVDMESAGEKWPSPEPTVEVDGLYRGVRMRKLTHLGEKWIDEACVRADKTYKQSWASSDAPFPFFISLSSVHWTSSSTHTVRESSVASARSNSIQRNDLQSTRHT